MVGWLADPGPVLSCAACSGGWNRWRHPKPFGPLEMTAPTAGEHFSVRERRPLLLLLLLLRGICCVLAAGSGQAELAVQGCRQHCPAMPPAHQVASLCAPAFPPKPCPCLPSWPHPPAAAGHDQGAQGCIRARLCLCVSGLLQAAASRYPPTFLSSEACYNAV